MQKIYKKAFTLVELLVVIAIVGLLSGVAVVATNGSRAKAKLAASQSFESSIDNAAGSEIVGQWLFDEGSGATVSDTSGNGNNGTITGATWTTGFSGSALNFNGGAQVALGNSAALNPGIFTITAWVKPGDISGPYNYIYSNARDCCGTYSGINFNFNYNLLSGTIWNAAGGWPGGSKQLNSTTVIPNNSPWVFTAFSYDGNKMVLYINGRMDSTYATTMGVGQPASFNTYIGRMGAGAWGLNGAIDQVKVYGSAIVAENIEKIYLAEKGKYLAEK